jgi:E1A/CREB-binding protein
MLKQAKVEGSVTHVTTLWDSFFEGGRDHRYDKPSVTLIPYLEGDYWPGEAENLLTQIQDGQRSAVTGRRRVPGSLATPPSRKCIQLVSTAVFVSLFCWSEMM